MEPILALLLIVAAGAAGVKLLWWAFKVSLYFFVGLIMIIVIGLILVAMGPHGPPPTFYQP